MREYVFASLYECDINVLYDISSTSCMVSWDPVAMSTLAIVAVTMFTFHAAKILSDMEER